jgi:uncharacterized delta-60 repeat protein
MKNFPYYNLRRVLAIMIVLIVCCAHVFGERAYEAWTARYSGPGNGANDASAIAVDANGNVYVTGRSQPGGLESGMQYATIKYDPEGTELWVARYSTRSGAQAKAIALDADSNVYVTGFDSGGLATLEDYATVKYDTDGNELWVARYDGPGRFEDIAWAIAVDGSGNVYVTGHSFEGDLLGYSFATIKYDAAGNQLWVARYGRGRSGAKALAVDKEGNVYVTGQTQGVEPTDYATIKYDTNGNQLWIATYRGPGRGEDRATALAIDAGGNVYVTGESRGDSSTQIDYATIKYDTNGKELWVARYDGPENREDEATALAVDDDGNVYVTGGSYVFNGPSTLRPEYATVKYDTNGVELWTARYVGADPDHYDYATAGALDRDRNVYVTGGSYGGYSTGTDYATIKYDTNGNELWVARYDGPAHVTDIASSLAIDSEGNVYVTGSSQRATGGWYDYATIKYSQK